MPSPAEFVTRVRSDHPRLFLSKEGVPALRQRAQTILQVDFAELCRQVDSLPENPQLEFRKDVCTVQGKKIVFKRLLNDQNACIYAVKSTGGHEALMSALAYVVTGKDEYRRKALAHIRLNVSFIDYCHASRMLYEWFHFTRLNTLIAYDWVAETLSPAERKSLMGPMLRHVQFMQNPGFKRNIGGVESGNYGETALTYYAGLAMLRDGIDNPLAEQMLEIGYRHFVDMMDYRDYVSGDSGVLSSICAGYSFGMYPISSFNFLRTLKSAADLDGTTQWKQLRRFPNWFLWAVIPSKQGLLEYGFGDSFHVKNDIPVWKLYAHMAQIIDLFGKDYPEVATAAWTAIGVLPKSEQVIRCKSFPILPYIMTNFDPCKPAGKSVEGVCGSQTGSLFRNGGLAIMRSGFTLDDTYAAFKAGARFVQHQHYDENSFVIYRGGFQALDTGCRGPKPHHRVYFPQTVAHNAMLIRQPGEKLPWYWYTGPQIKEKLTNDGGQNRMGTGRLLGFETNDSYTAVAGDATACYAPGKCREALRVFVFVKPCYFVVYDRVESRLPEQEKVFLLHCNREPQQLANGLFRSEEGTGALFVRTLLPLKPICEKIGGQGKEFWTQGKNYLPHRYQSMAAQHNNLGAWRLEIKETEPKTRTHFLHFLQTADRLEKQPVKVQSFANHKVEGLVFQTVDGRTVRIDFYRQGEPGGDIHITREGRTLIRQKLLKPLKHKDFENRYAARIDVIPEAPELRFEIENIGDTSTRETPRWLKGGRGAILQFSAKQKWQTGKVTLMARGNGRAHMLLRGPDAKGPEEKRLRRWVAFDSVKLNGRELMPKTGPAVVWHDAPLRLDFQCQNGQKLVLTVTYRTISK